VLALVAAAMLANLYPLDTQDTTRLALSLSVLKHGTLEIDRYHTLVLDRAFRAGHWYSDKAPGVSFLALPAVAALQGLDELRGAAPSLLIWLREGQLWLLRCLTGGVGLLLAVFLAGRSAEGLRRGAGAPVAVTLGLGTILGPLGATMMEHDLSAGIAFAAFVAATREPRAAAVLAGALAGLALLFDYTAAVVVCLLGLYLLVGRGGAALARFVLGLLPAVLLLGLYDALAFGSPFHLSYRYVANEYTADQRQGFFGIGLPTLHGLRLEFVGARGLLAVSPVLLVALGGLMMLARSRRRLEGLLCLAVVVAYAAIDGGYFDPYGGASPGPRFFTPALPFLTVGLVEAFRRWPRLSGALALASIALVTLDTFTWQGVATLQQITTDTTIWQRLGLPAAAGVALIVAAAAAGTVLGAAALRGSERAEPAGEGA
jgi:hypothetical protein